MSKFAVRSFAELEALIDSGEITLPIKFFLPDGSLLITFHRDLLGRDFSLASGWSNGEAIRAESFRPEEIG